MAYAITDKCVGEVYATCTLVCPTECFKSVEKDGKPFMVIDPGPCIDCGLCLPECPIGAIVPTDEDEEAHRLNAELAPKALPKMWPGRPSNDPPRNPENKLVR